MDPFRGSVAMPRNNQARISCVKRPDNTIEFYTWNYGPDGNSDAEAGRNPVE